MAVLEVERTEEPTGPRPRPHRFPRRPPPRPLRDRVPRPADGARLPWLLAGGLGLLSLLSRLWDIG